MLIISKLYAVKTASSKEVITSLNENFQYFSEPRIIILDRDSALTWKDVEHFLNEYAVRINYF